MPKHKDALGWSLQQRGKTWYVYHRFTADGKLVGKTTGERDHEAAIRKALDIVRDARAEAGSGEAGHYLSHIVAGKIRSKEEEVLLGSELDKTNPRMTTLWMLGTTYKEDSGIFHDWVMKNMSPASSVKMRCVWKLLVMTHPDIHRINEITPEHVQRCFEIKRTQVSERTLVNFWCSSFRGFFKKLIALGWYHRENPAPLLRMPAGAVKTPVVRPLTKEQIDALAAVFEGFGPAYGLLFQLAIHTGMRKSEITNLRWEDVDLDQRPRPVLHVRPHAEDREKGIARSTVKTRNSIRIVPLRKELIECLAPHRKDVGYVLESDKYLSDRSTFRLPSLLRNQTLEVCPGFHLHLTRHTFISNALMAGVPPVKVSKWAGDSLGMILDTYTHYIPDDSIDDF